MPFLAASILLYIRADILRGSLDAATLLPARLGVQMLASVTAYLVSLTTVFFMAKSIKIVTRFPVAVIALNWGSLIISMMALPVNYLLNSVMGDDPQKMSGISLALGIFLMFVSFVATLNIFRVTLKLVLWQAATFVFVVNIFEITANFAVRHLFGY
jgi:hypothetical protein